MYHFRFRVVRGRASYLLYTASRCPAGVRRAMAIVVPRGNPAWDPALLLSHLVRALPRLWTIEPGVLEAKTC
jgi:hypothetical protein